MPLPPEPGLCLRGRAAAHHQQLRQTSMMLPCHQTLAQWHRSSSTRRHTTGGRHTRPPPPRSAAAASGALAGLPLPSADYDYKAHILPETQAVISQHYPQLQDLVNAGNLVVWQRPTSYRERRKDGYEEPQLIFMLGTAHVSSSSAAEVHRLVQAVQPDAVVVELCKSRLGVLALSDRELAEQQQLAAQVAATQQPQQQPQQPGGRNAVPASSDSASSSQEEQAAAGPSVSSSPAQAAASAGQASSSSSSSRPGLMSLTGRNPLEALTRSARLGGQSGLLLRLLINGPVQKAADQLGVQPGGEFRAAAVAADAAGASLVLGDRPIEITLQRAWAALSWQRRLQLLADLALAAVAPQEEQMTVEAVEALRADDAIGKFFAALSARYPELVAPLIAERDLYLTWSLRRSKAVNGAAAVVGVMGKGHLRGVTYALKHDGGSSSLRFKDLVGGKNGSGGKRAAALGLLRRLLLEGLLGLGLWAAWVASTSAAAGL